MELDTVARQFLRLYSSPWVEPAVKRIDVYGEQNIEDLTSDNAFSGTLPSVSFDELVSIFRQPDTARGMTLFIVGSAGQSKSRLAVETAAKLLREGLPCILIRHQDAQYDRPSA